MNKLSVAILLTLTLGLGFGLGNYTGRPSAFLNGQLDACSKIVEVVNTSGMGGYCVIESSEVVLGSRTFDAMSGKTTTLRLNNLLADMVKAGAPDLQK